MLGGCVTETAATRETGVEGGLRSVLAALDLLDCFADEDELGVTELAKRIGVAKSTAHRLLTTLCARGLASRNDETGRYRLGMHLYELGQLAVGRNEIRNAALPLLQELQQATGGTIHLAVPDISEVVYLERLVSRAATARFSRVSRRLPAHCTSSGKAIAAFTPDLAAARSTAGFTSLTSRSIHTARQFALALAETRKRGYAVSVDEAVEGLTSVAAPVKAHDGSARAAISVVGPTDRVLADVDRPARLVQLAAQKLSRELCL
jgi:DNA-binding IclR family transcriptional regulator